MRSSGYATLATWRTRHSTTSRRPVLGRGGARDGRRCLQQSARRAHVLGDPRAAPPPSAVSVGIGRPWLTAAHSRDTECRRRRQRVAQTNGIDVPRGTPRQPAAIQLQLMHVRRGTRTVVEHELERWCTAPGRRSPSRPAHTTVDRSGCPIATSGRARPDNTHRFGPDEQLVLDGLVARKTGRSDRRRRSPTWLTSR